MRVIDAEIILNRYQEICMGVACMDCPFYKDGCAVEKLILESAMVDAAPVRHGRWVYKEFKISKDDGIGYFLCSECGHASWTNEYNYCFDCGAKMDLDEVNDDN